MKKKKQQFAGKNKSASKNKSFNNKKVLDVFFKTPSKPLNYKQISSALGANTPQERSQIIHSLAQLTQKEELTEVSPGQYKLNQKVEYVVGKLDITQSGVAFLTIDNYPEDIYVAKENTKNALNGDWVRAQLFKTRKKFEAKVVSVLERTESEFVGDFEWASGKKYGFVKVNRRQIHVDIFIPKENASQADDGDKVVVKIVDWREDEDSPRGKIEAVLGKAGEHDTEIHAIMADYGLPYIFPDEVEKEAASLSLEITPEEISKRKDFRAITTFTIDPKDAKDFDDALSYQKLENGNIEVGIHIADVSHYVSPETLLDQEAFKRATSVYLVDRVVPMLPEILSNRVCSLRPNEEKLCFSAVFELDPQAQIKKQWFGRTVITSDRRFTYEEAQEIIEGKEGDFKKEIEELNDLAKLMRSERLKNGAIAFDRVEVKFNLDENSNPIGVYYKESKEAHHLIEEFMLLANKKVSEFVSVGKQLKTPTPRTFVYRIHDSPDPAKLASLRDFVKTLGYHINIDGKKQISTSLNKLLGDVKGKGEENMIETLAMRSMSKAVYSSANIGHYGLAFDYYSHFTSPIRRYPDVIAHRLLQHYLEGGKSPQAQPLEEECEHCSDRERLAADAERDSIKYMQVKFMQEHIGEVFDGIITGVTEWGIYVEAKLSKAEGLIRLRDLTNDHYNYDDKTHSIIGQRTKSRISLGDEVQVKLMNTDLENKTIDFALVDF